jgi:predicted nuclease with TOPRIM domain
MSRKEDKARFRELGEKLKALKEEQNRLREERTKLGEKIRAEKPERPAADEAGKAKA